MRKLLLLLVALTNAACQADAPAPEGEPGGGGNSGGGGAGAGGDGYAPPSSAGSAGTAAPGGGGGSVGGAGGGGPSSVGGASSASGGDAGMAGSSGIGGGAGGPVAFGCSQLTGPNVAGEWFEAGFETAVGTAQWQVKAPHHSFVEDWADPAHDVWRDSDCQGTYSNCETKSKCEGAAVDRVLFVTQIGEYLNAPQATWEARITAAITTFKSKYPALKRVELLTFVRSPDGESCGGETTVAPALDAAHAALAAASAGFVTVGPHLTASTCALFSGPPHLNAQGNAEIAAQLAEHYGQP